MSFCVAEKKLCLPFATEKDEDEDGLQTEDAGVDSFKPVRM